MTKKYEVIISFFIYLLIFSSIYLGYNHGIYAQDYHHSFFILSSVIDYQNGLKLYEDIFLQYGPGQVIFFKILSNFVKINLVSISLITSIIYALNLFILFKIFKKFVSINISFFIILIIFLIHPYNIYPWPDYFSGFCMTIFFYFLLNNNLRFNYFLCSVFLFLAVFFRSTYLISILFSIISYSILLLILNKSNSLRNTFIYFFTLIGVFFIILFYYGSLETWYDQSIGQISYYAGTTKHIHLYDKITSYVGEFGFIALKISYYFFNSVMNLFNVLNFENIAFILFIAVNFYYIFLIIIKKIEITQENKKFIFISLIGLFGFIQALMLMEIFRIINSMVGIFIVGLFLVNNEKRFIVLKKNSKIILSILIIYSLLLLSEFPFNKYNKNNYTNFDNKYFLNKKITPELKIYYLNLKDFICNKENILISNISLDPAIPYLCDNNNKVKTNISTLNVLFLKKLNKSEHERLFINHELYENELLFTNIKIKNSSKVVLIKQFKNYHKPISWFSDINVYKKKQN